jgi:hypothetical protein
VHSVIFTKAARQELIEAQDWYEGEASGLGRRFRRTIDALIQRMSENPRQFPVVLRTSVAPSCAGSLMHCFSLSTKAP